MVEVAQMGHSGALIRQQLSGQLIWQTLMEKNQQSDTL
jgi:hypothetical protein